MNKKPDNKQTAGETNFAGFTATSSVKGNSLTRLFLAGLLFVACGLANAQHKTVGITFAPTDKAFGVRVDKEISGFGYYGGASWGNYRFIDGNQLKDHVKLSGGLVRYSPNRNHRFTTMFSAGLAFHSYGEFTGEPSSLPAGVYKTISGDFGVGLRVDHINIGWCVDPFKKEVAVNLGISFN